MQDETVMRHLFHGKNIVKNRHKIVIIFWSKNELNSNGIFASVIKNFLY
jgi:hypothetical protein